jgi:diguanylate cyclase (GGDEF)-like protein
LAAALSILREFSRPFRKRTSPADGAYGLSDMRLNTFLERRSPLFISASGVLLVALLGILDYLNGPDFSLLIFYAVPVYVAAWYSGRRAGLALCAASGLAWVVGAYATSEHFSTPVIAYWNAFVRLGFMVVLAHIFAAFRTSLAHERELARTDYLTGAFNGRSFGETAAAEIARARRHAHPFSVAYVDVDDFKQVNDRQGHSAGDRLLKAVADALRRNVRGVDTVARIGGDEFAVLMPETDSRAAQVVMRRMRRRLLEETHGAGWPVTVSVGVVTFDTPPDSVDDLLRAADDVMYSAKRGGKNALRHITADNVARPADAA